MNYDDLSFSISFDKAYSPLKPYDKLRRNFVNSLRFKSFKPGKYLSNGACGAVWAAECSSDNGIDDLGMLMTT